MTELVPDPTAEEPRTAEPFQIRLDNFEGPFDLLLQLISKHRLDITEVALSRVTDEFIAHIRAAGDQWDLDQTSHFILVAATLLDLKAARLLPSGEVDDLEDLELLEARDLLFARLMQYKAFKEVSTWMAEVLQAQGRYFPRPGGLEPAQAELMPEVIISITPERFAELAGAALAPKPVDTVSLAHLHASTVTVREQATVCATRLREAGTLSFRRLVADAPDKVTTVCRFLALLELFREKVISFEQPKALGELLIRWTAEEDQDFEISDEFDVVDDGTEPATTTEDPDD